MAVTGMVYFCPELRLYRYQISDSQNRDNDVDYKFDADELEDALVAILSRPEDEKEGSHQEAKVMADMTGLARVNPHKIVRLDIEKNKIEIAEPADFWKKHDAEREALEAAAK